MLHNQQAHPVILHVLSGHARYHNAAAPLHRAAALEPYSLTSGSPNLQIPIDFRYPMQYPLVLGATCRDPSLSLAIIQALEFARWDPSHDPRVNPAC